MDMSDAKKATAATDPNDDFTGIVQLRRLKPNTDYHYRISVDGWMSPAQWKFTTYAEQHEPTAFTVGFGGGSSFHPLNERIWKVLSTHNLTAFLTLGDNVYIDHPSRPAVQKYSYYRRQSSPFYRIFSSEVPFYAIWDDHDFGTNDSWGGPETFEPAWKVKVLEIFKQNWNNPSYGGGEEQPGVWFDYYIGDVHFIMLDGRYYRTDPKADDASLLGPAQIQWLQKTLKNSRGTFKVLASPVPWASGAKGGTQMTPQGRQPGGLDTWDGFPEERSAIYDFLHENKIEGVVLISADRHRSDLWKIDRENGYPLYEFESSRLTNIHVHSIMEGSIFGYNEKQSFGTIEFNTTLENPAVTYRIYSIDNEFIHEFTVSKDYLSY
jgi:alkaline phosphatase D